MRLPHQFLRHADAADVDVTRGFASSALRRQVPYRLAQLRRILAVRIQKISSDSFPVLVLVLADALRPGRPGLHPFHPARRIQARGIGWRRVRLGQVRPQRETDGARVVLVSVSLIGQRVIGAGHARVHRSCHADSLLLTRRDNLLCRRQIEDGCCASRPARQHVRDTYKGDPDSAGCMRKSAYSGDAALLQRRSRVLWHGRIPGRRARRTSVDNLVDGVARTYGRIDVFVNTAGFTFQIGAANQTPIRDMSLADWRSLDEVHNIGCFLLTRAVLRVMDKQVAVEPISTFGDRPPIRGAIVMLTSLASEGTFRGVGNYIAAKHAVKGMVQTAAIENASRGIRVNAVAPSYVSGPMMNEFLAASPEFKKVMLGDLPMKRLVGPGEVADAVVFLASSASSYVNGHTLVVDGGASLPLSNSPF
ncbi:hypothetical protein GGR58DRAFT_136258 [Xylaria digitata]|nr:hypothetical protein GGR58DRAFT_136258 [Xylaria digitata]